MRSRRRANLLALDRLGRSRQITDEDVVVVLDLWYFGKNTTRVNVFPVGATSVESDTLGLVRSSGAGEKHDATEPCSPPLSHPAGFFLGKSARVLARRA